ncbi:MAG: hypothetical protein ABIH83_04045 [Candidatus Micrarchaeota archaeon]
MFEMFSLTIKKIIYGIIFSIGAYIIASVIGMGSLWTQIFVLSFWAGMLFPDFDVFAGFLKNIANAVFVALVVFAIIAFLIFPHASSTAGFCSDSSIYSIFGISGAGTYCNIALTIIFLLIAFFILRLLVGWLPYKGSFHSWPVAFVLTVLSALLVRFFIPCLEPCPIFIGVGIGYALHLIIDGVKGAGR